MNTNSRAIVAGIAAGLAIGAAIAAGGTTTAPAAHAAPTTFCNTFGGSGWANTTCNGPGGPFYCNSFGPGTNGGGGFGRPNGGAGDWSNTVCS
jgi:hypothetical protein